MAETPPPTLLLPLSGAQSPSGLLGSAAVAILTLIVLYAVAFAPREEKVIPAYELVGMSKGDTFSEARQHYARSARSILQKGLTEVRQ